MANSLEDFIQALISPDPKVIELFEQGLFMDASYECDNSYDEMSILKYGSSKGCVDSTLQLSYFYENSRLLEDAINTLGNIPPDSDQYSNAQNRIGVLYESIGDEEKSIQHFEMAGNDSDALVNLRRIYKDNPGKKFDAVSKLCHLRVTQFYEELGDYYLLGYGVEKNVREGLKWIYKSIPVRSESIQVIFQRLQVPENDQVLKDELLAEIGQEEYNMIMVIVEEEERRVFLEKCSGLFSASKARDASALDLVQKIKDRVW